VDECASYRRAEKPGLRQVKCRLPLPNAPGGSGAACRAEIMT